MSPMTQTQQWLRIKNEYRAANGNTPASARTILDWAVDTGRWKINERQARQRAAAELAEAMRSEMTVDAHGNEVRVNLAFEDPQLGWQWDQRDTITRPNIELHLSRGRRLVYGELKAQICTANDYMDLHPDEPPLQYSLNFAGDLADDGISIPTTLDLDRLLDPTLAGPVDLPPSSRSSSRPSGPSSRPPDSSPNAR